MDTRNQYSNSHKGTQNTLPTDTYATLKYLGWGATPKMVLYELLTKTRYRTLEYAFTTTQHDRSVTVSTLRENTQQAYPTNLKGKTNTKSRPIVIEERYDEALREQGNFPPMSKTPAVHTQPCPNSKTQYFTLGLAKWRGTPTPPL